MFSCSILAVLPAVGIALHSRAATSHGQQLGLLAGRAEPETQGPECSQLTNVQGTHYTMPVLIGTPPQKFDLIPDTGSPWVIVADSKCTVCDCAKLNKCVNRNKSRTLHVPTLETNLPETHVLSFGSGPISILVATDEVRIDGTKIRHTMDRGVLLMEDNGLGFSGPFEGLFGLGIPEYKLGQAFESMKHSYTDGFLHRAGIQSFSLCLSDRGWSGEGGVLRYNAPEGKELLGITERTMHWQLAFYGATVGAGKQPPEFCNYAAPGQSSPCAAIIDSGTTYILGPYDQLDKLFDGLCDGWERCRTKYTRFRDGVMAASKRIGSGNSSQAKPDLMSKAELFQLLLNDCHTWMNKKNGIQELPKVSWVVKGRAGNEFHLELDPWDYIISEQTYKMQITYGKIDGMTYVTGWERRSKQIWACNPAFAFMDFPTERNGPAWILGLPIFYSHRVSYNIEHNPPSMSFTKELCGGCTKAHRELHRWNRTGGQDTPKMPRKMRGEPHLPQAARKMVL
mmetsp:Transcript_66393/g.187055  ORF Transcript_66393/g.187055 Transcript_66393/m.187055 type:complete len:510 (+) Transcript_66393:52-1581(+)